jgi:hypothetical protein
MSHPKPVPLANQQRNHPSVAISTTMFQTELETTVALWRPLLPFPVLARMPKAEELVRCSIQIGNALNPIGEAAPLPPYTDANECLRSG